MERITNSLAIVAVVVIADAVCLAATTAPTVSQASTAAAPAAMQSLPPPAIQQLGALGPVTGSQETIGSIELTTNAPASGVTVTLTSNAPRLVTMPATVTIAGGRKLENFPIKTLPVASSTVVTLTAQTATSKASFALTVLPPALSLLSCAPNSIPGGVASTCTVWLTGAVASTTIATANNGLIINLTANNQYASMPNSVMVRAGQSKGEFHVTAVPLPQSMSVTISASYAGVTKTAPLQILPVALSALYIVRGTTSDHYVDANSNPCMGSPCEIIGGNYLPVSFDVAPLTEVGVVAHLTASAPAGGMRIKLKLSDPNLPAAFQDLFPDIVVPAGADRGIQKIQTSPIATSTTLNIVGTDPFTGTARMTSLGVEPPRVLYVWCGQSLPQGCGRSHVPLGGAQVTIRVMLLTPAPSGGMPYDVDYHGNLDVNGPAHISVPGGQKETQFQITVSPCAINPNCTVGIGVGGRSTSVIVSP